MNKKLVVALSFALAFCLLGALLAQTDRRNSGGAKVKLYSGDGKVIQEWTTPGEVEVRDGVFSFIEARTDRMIRVSGTVVVSAAP